MKYLLIILLVSSCCTHAPRLIHYSLDEIEQPLYIQLLDSEKSCLIDSAVDKIHANKTACYEQIKEYNGTIFEHNKKHTTK